MRARDAAEVALPRSHPGQCVLDADQSCVHTAVPNPIINALIEHVGMVMKVPSTADELLIGTEHVIHAELLSKNCRQKAEDRLGIYKLPPFFAPVQIDVMQRLTFQMCRPVLLQFLQMGRIQGFAQDDVAVEVELEVKLFDGFQDTAPLSIV